MRICSAVFPQLLLHSSCISGGHEVHCCVSAAQLAPTMHFIQQDWVDMLHHEGVELGQLSGRYDQWHNANELQLLRNY